MTRFEFYLNLNKYKDKQDEKNEENSLQHYGTLGQKWGVRKWQNPDGTFNEAGKERYFGKNGTTKIGSSDKKIAKLTKKANNMFNTMYDNMDPETIKKQQDYMNNFSLNVNVNNPNQDQKMGAGIIPTVIFAMKAVDNYGDVQGLRDSYNKFMNESDTDYSDSDRLSIMNNKKKIAKIEQAMKLGEADKVEKLLNKIKDKDAEAVKKFVGDLNKKNNDMHKVPEEVQDGIEKTLEDNKLGSISKPKVNKKYLNDDGTLNERGKVALSKKKKASDIASSVFLALRNCNLFDLAVMPVSMAAMTLTGFGIPMALAVGLGGAIGAAGAAGIDNALYKKLEKRADAYYEMLQ